MNSSIKLTDAQLVILSAASRREDRCLIAPKNLKRPAAEKLAAKLLAARLVREIKAKPNMPVWRRDEDAGRAFALNLTAAGLKAVATKEDNSQPEESAGASTGEETSKIVARRTRRHQGLRDGAAALSARWEHLPTEALHGLTRAILVRAQVHADRIDLDVASGRLVRRLRDEGGKEAIDVRPQNERSSANTDDADRGDRLDEPLIRLSIPASLKRTGNEMKFVVDGVANSAPADATLIRLLLRGSKIRKRMFAPGEPPLGDIAAEEGVASTYATRLVQLTFLAPDIVAAILAGKQPAGLTANKLMADTRLPLDWSEQRTALGFT